MSAPKGKGKGVYQSAAKGLYHMFTLERQEITSNIINCDELYIKGEKHDKKADENTDEITLLKTEVNDLRNDLTKIKAILKALTDIDV